jgi:4-amino-4-deoxy-L-arabinose transferase-like glycosyltransferase
MRLAALLTFLATGSLVYVLLRHLRGNAAALIGLAAFVFSPFALLESSTATIEYLAAGAGLAYAYWALRWHETRRLHWLMLAIAVGSVAMLVKGATAAMYFVPVLAVASLAIRQIDRTAATSAIRSVAGIGALVLVPGLIGIGWTMHADAIKAASPFTATLTQSALFHWHFGYLEQRTNVSAWWPLVFRNNFMLFGGMGWAFGPAALAALSVDRRPQRLFLLALFIGGLAGPLVFLNLYLVHTYYVGGLSPIVAIAIGVVGGALWRWRARAAAKVAGGVLALGWVITIVATRDVWLDGFQQVWDPTMALPAAQDIAANSVPGEIVVVTGRDWDPAAMYYADRWGLMFPGGPERSLARALEPEVRATLVALGYRRLFHCPFFEPEGCTTIIDLVEGD